MVSSTLDGWHVAAVPHARPTLCTQTVQGARNATQSTELMQQASSLQLNNRQHHIITNAQHPFISPHPPSLCLHFMHEYAIQQQHIHHRPQQQEYL